MSQPTASRGTPDKNCNNGDSVIFSTFLGVSKPNALEVDDCQFLYSSAKYVVIVSNRILFIDDV